MYPNPRGTQLQQRLLARSRKLLQVMAGPSEEVEFHSENARDHQGIQAELEVTKFGFQRGGYEDEILFGFEMHHLACP